MKGVHDPGNVFRLNQNIPPGAGPDEAGTDSGRGAQEAVRGGMLWFTRSLLSGSYAALSPRSRS
ncbi:hypothetical protein [Streptomyces sp. NPDC058595]|uniref:hypothetical protein n=1 Tax=Streptomyces sp. NPDC058595 TaxID=3346550 RepID=UPI0036566697